MLGGKVTITFAIKCTMVSNPKIFLTVVVFVSVSVLSFVIKIIEGPLNLIDNDNMDYSMLSNCVWNIFVTMTSGID